jgi:hypothetical protein
MTLTEINQMAGFGPAFPSRRRFFSWLLLLLAILERLMRLWRSWIEKGGDCPLPEPEPEIVLGERNRTLWDQWQDLNDVLVRDGPAVDQALSGASQTYI